MNYGETITKESFTTVELTEDEKEVLNVLKFVNRKKLCPHCYDNLVNFLTGGKN